MDFFCKLLNINAEKSSGKLFIYGKRNFPINDRLCLVARNHNVSKQMSFICLTRCIKTTLEVILFIASLPAQIVFVVFSMFVYQKENICYTTFNVNTEWVVYKLVSLFCEFSS